VNGSKANDPELDALLGAYALDALEPDERVRVDEYIAGNAHARDEVDELRESAAALALAPVDDAAAPADLWDRISSSIAEEPAAVTSLESRRRSVRVSAASVLAVAAAILVAVLVTTVVVRGNTASHTGDLAAAFDHATKQPGAREISLTPTNGAEVARVVVLPDGTGYLRNDAMKTLPADLTYQLWALSGDKNHPVAISAGVLGADPHAVGFHLDGPVNGFGVTVEHAPGVAQSTQPMYASATVT
jgi:anti-sigma-K factor RskA